MIFAGILQICSIPNQLPASMRKIPVLLVFFCATMCRAQTVPALTVEKIMQDAKWMGISPTNIQWDQNSRDVYFNWNPEGAPRDPLYEVSVDGHTPHKVADSAKRRLSRNQLVYSRDHSKVLFERNGDIFMQYIKGGPETLLVSTSDRETGPAFSANESRVYFQKGDNLFSLGIAGGGLIQLTNFTRVKRQSQHPAAPQEDWLKKDQLQTFDLIRRQARDQQLDEAERQASETKQPREFYLDEKSQAGNMTVSPDGCYITFRVTRQPEGGRTIIVPNYVTGSGFTEDISGRTKVGAPVATTEMYVYDLPHDTVYSISTAGIPGIKDLPAYLKEYPQQWEERSKRNEDRKASIGNPVWNPEGTAAVINIASQDGKDRWIMRLELPGGKLQPLEHQHDDAWIGGPGIAAGFNASNVSWTDNRTICFQSEATGYSHLYTLNIQTGERRQLTSGKYEVQTLRLSNDKKFFYFTANIEHPGITHFYKIPVGGGTPVRLTSLKGGNEVTLSPDEKWLAIRYSYTTRPWELYLQENRSGARAVQITKSTTPEFDAYPWREPEMILFKNRYNTDVYAQVMQPVKPDPRHPAVVFVHSNGYLQNVHYMWSYHFREYMFNNMLVDHGYTVINIDYNASSGYGRDTRTGIYRHMGGRDLADLTDGAKLLAEKYGVDPKRIGLYGGSYGGFLTLMAMFTEPDVFTSGAALRSVTDWAHYNQRYTANILNEPASDEKAYRQSSPIYFAPGLKGNLLMTHGIVDVNVNFQDIVRLTQRLIELGKNNWELAVYPLEDHNFTDPPSWTDQYKRIFKLFEETLKK